MATPEAPDSSFRPSTAQKLEWFLQYGHEERTPQASDEYAKQYVELSIVNSGYGTAWEVLQTGDQLFKQDPNKARIVIVAGLPGSGKTDLISKFVSVIVRQQIKDYEEWYEDIYGEKVSVYHHFANWDFHEEAVKDLQQETLRLQEQRETVTPGDEGLIWVEDETKTLRPFPQAVYKLIGSIARIPESPGLIDFSDFNRVADEFLSCVPIPGEQYQDEFLRFTGQLIVNEIRDRYAYVDKQRANNVNMQLVIQLDTLALTAAHVAINIPNADENRVDELIDLSGSWKPREHIEVREYNDEAITDAIEHSGELKAISETDINIIVPFPSPRLLLLIQFREYLLNLKQDARQGNINEQEMLEKANEAARIFKLEEFSTPEMLQQVQEGGSVKQVLGAWKKSHTIAEAVRNSDVAQRYQHQFGPIIRFHTDIVDRKPLDYMSSTHKDFQTIIKDAVEVADILGEDPYMILEFLGDHLTHAAMMDQYLSSKIDATPDRLDYPHNIHYKKGALIYALLLNEPYLKILDPTISSNEDRDRLKKLLEEQKRKNEI